MFEDKLEVKAEKKKMAEAAIISEEKTENADNSVKKEKKIWNLQEQTIIT